MTNHDSASAAPAVASPVPASPPSGTNSSGRRGRGVPGALGLLQQRDFRLLLVGSVMVSAGYNLRQMAQAWLVLDLTGSPLKAGIVNAMPGLAVFTSLYGGAVLDRADRRAVLLRARVALTLLILTAAVLVATGVIQWWYLVLIGLGLSRAFTFHDTANQSFAMDIVGRDRLMKAASISTIVSNVAAVATPAVGGALIAADISWAFWLLAGLYAVSFLSVLPIRTRTASRAATRNVLAEMREGLSYAARSPVIMWLLVLSSVFLFMGVTSAIIPVFARDIFDVGATGYGVLATVQAAGSLSGAVALTLAGDVRRPGVLMFVTLIAAGGALALLGASPWYPLALAALFVLGVTQTVLFITLPTTLQKHSAPEMRSRVVALFFMVVTLMMLGWVVGGALASLIDARGTAFVAAAGTAGLTLLVFGSSRTLRELN